MSQESKGLFFRYLLGGSDVVKETDAYGAYALPYRVAFALLAAAVLAAAMWPLAVSGNAMPNSTHALLMVAVIATEPFLWMVMIRNREHPTAYMALVATNIAVLVGFFLSHGAESHTQALYFLIVLAALDFAVGTSGFSRVLPLALVLALGGALPGLPATIGVAMFLVFVLREMRTMSGRRHGRATLDELRRQIVAAKDGRHRDELTGMYNRGIIPDRIEALFDRCTEESWPFGLVLIDIDNLKAANDTRGHGFGDELISGVAREILSTKRDGDFAIRYGGDEIMLVTTGIAGYAALSAVAERIRARVEAMDLDGFPASVSVGMAFFPETSVIDFPDAVRKADQAMYEAKRRGRNRVVAYPEISES